MAARISKRMVSRGTSETCRVAVVYEDIPARESAIELSEAVSHRFIGDLDFEFTWWRFDYLSDPIIAIEAAQAAANAHLILVSLHGSRDLPKPVKAWFEKWISNRAEIDGALAVFRSSDSAETADNSYLREAAARAGLEFLPLSGTEPALPPIQHFDNHDLLSDADIVQAPDRPSSSYGWGLNE